MDWNWFFSTLSQSAAATTGIFGAFIITKIFTNQAVFSEKTNRLKMLLAQAKKISADVKDCDIDWYSKTKNNAALKSIKKILDKALTTTTASDVSDEIIENIRASEKFSIFTPPEEIKAAIKTIIQDICDKNLATKKQQEEEESRLQQEELNRIKRDEQLSGKINLSDRPRATLFREALSSSQLGYIMPNRPPLDLPEIPPNARLDVVFNRAIQLHSDAKHHAAITSDFLDSIKGNPESPSLISYSLLLVILIFIVGVIYPLSFMPMLPNTSPEIGYSLQTISQTAFSLKGFLLALISVFFIMVTGIFAHANRAMKYSTNDIKNIEKYTNPNAYSHYFKFLN